MSSQNHAHLLADRAFLQERLSALPVSARIMRLSTESRLRAIEAELEQATSLGPEPVKTRLTFSGRPVVKRYGVFAEFGTLAVAKFSEAVAAIAASMFAPLAAMGPIPNKDQNQLLIVGTAIGSFGFELEENRAGLLPVEAPSAVAQALERTQEVLQGTIGTDDQLADSVSETDPRALDKVRAFLQVLAENDAICAFQIRDRAFRFTDVGQVKNSLERIGKDNLHETEEFLEGQFEGVLPRRRRTFEFKPLNQDEVIVGKLGPAITDPEDLNANLHKPTRIKVLVTRVGSGRPRYMLLDRPEWITTS